MTKEQLMQRLRGTRVDGYPDKATMQFGADEIERLQKREGQLMEFLRSFISGGVNQDFKPWARELYQKLYSSHEPSEQRSEVNSIDDVAAICHSVTGLCCHILGSPGGPCTIGNCAAVRGYLGGPEFARGVEQPVATPGAAKSEDAVIITAVSSGPRGLLSQGASRDAFSGEATRVTVGCSQCTATVSLPQRDGLVDIASLGLWYFSTPTGWRCPAHAPAQRT